MVEIINYFIVAVLTQVLYKNYLHFCIVNGLKSLNLCKNYL